MPKLTACGLFLLLLAPSAWFAWRNREMPQFGRTHDDAIHYIAAKSLAEGRGYRILNLPGTPYETKYPPMIAWVLMLAWKLNPQFPDNLTIATAIQWTMIPIFLALVLTWLGRIGFSGWRSWAVLALLAVSPYTVLFGAGIATETLFGIFLMIVLLAMERVRNSQSWIWAALAGLASGCAFLTRSSGIVLLAAGPVIFLLWRKRREAIAFLAVMLPIVVSWMLWAKLHRTPSSDVMQIYNTDYLKYYALNLRWSDAGPILWNNLGQTVYFMSAVILPVELNSFFWQLVRDTASIGIIAGLFRCRKETVLWPYMVFTLLTIGELVVVPATPNLRLMYPMAPLFLLGAVTEAEHFGAMLQVCRRHRDLSQRIAAWTLGFAAAACLLAAISAPLVMIGVQLPAMASENIRIRDENRVAYSWMAKNLDPSARILTANPALYLFTGRQSGNPVYSYIYWYRKDRDSALATFTQLPDYATERGFDYLYLHDADYATISSDHADEARAIVEASSGLAPVYQSGNAKLYRPVDTRKSSRLRDSLKP